MTPQEKRIAIAEFDGWKVWQCNNHGTIKYFPAEHKAEGYWEIGIRMPDYRLDVSNLPDYLNDLNAMHKAEKKLTSNEFQVYFDSLVSMIAVSAENPRHGDYPRVVHATASQRADALLLTIGKMI